MICTILERNFHGTSRGIGEMRQYLKTFFSSHPTWQTSPMSLSSSTKIILSPKPVSWSPSKDQKTSFRLRAHCADSQNDTDNDNQVFFEEKPSESKNQFLDLAHVLSYFSLIYPNIKNTINNNNARIWGLGGLSICICLCHRSPGMSLLKVPQTSTHLKALI